MAPEDGRNVDDSPKSTIALPGADRQGAKQRGIGMQPVPEILRWLGRTPVQTFIVCPLIVIVAELVLRRGDLVVVPWGALLLVWGYMQYREVGRYRLGLAGGGPGIEVPPQRILAQGPYAYTRNPMYLGHLIFMLGLAITFWSWVALFMLIARAGWFHGRVLQDEARLEKFSAPTIATTARA